MPIFMLITALVRACWRGGLLGLMVLSLCLVSGCRSSGAGGQDGGNNQKS